MQHGHWLTTLVLLLGISGLPVCACAADSTLPTGQRGIVLVMDLTLRVGPGLDRRPLKTLEKGASVWILESREGWLKVNYEGQTGYILDQSEYIRVATAAEPSQSNAPGHAQPITEAQHDMREIRQALEQSNAQVRSFAQTESAIVNELDDCERALNSTRKQASAMEKELAQLEIQIAGGRQALERLEHQIDANERHAARRVVALYKLGWLGHVPVLASAESSMDFFTRKSNLERILIYDERLLFTLASERQSQAHLLDKMNVDLAAKQAAEAQLKDELARMTLENQKRTRLLADIQSQKALKMATLESLEQSAKALDRTLLSLGSPEPAADSMQALRVKPFSSLKGLLNSPVRGKIVSFFGSYKSNGLDLASFHSGITIRADRGEPIRSVGQGTTLYADWFQGYGNMIIIDHGDHYYTLYAHLDELFKSEGSRVEAEEVIATVGDTGSLSGPGLHFEVRHHGKPLDPLQWLDNIKRSHLNE
jgi:septal ring factor EnvC (AmiA/AmiB activator)